MVTVPFGKAPRFYFTAPEIKNHPFCVSPPNCKIPSLIEGSTLPSDFILFSYTCLRFMNCFETSFVFTMAFIVSPQLLKRYRYSP